jgi:predicted ATP-dependent endonuclease of OLD family
MKVARLSISNFRGIKNAEFHFNGHALLVGPNNVGKSTVCEALDLVLDRIASEDFRQLKSSTFITPNIFLRRNRRRVHRRRTRLELKQF